jgi:hypothetical protein
MACEQVEHSPGNVAAGSLLVLGGLGGTVALGNLCHGLEQGGAGGMPGDGGQRDSAYTLPEPGNLANFLSSLGFTNSDGTPVDANSVSSLYDQYLKDQQEGGGGPSKAPYLGGFGTQTGGSDDGEPGAEGRGPAVTEVEGPRALGEGGEGTEPSRAEGETFRGQMPDGGEPPQAPTTDAARNRWQLLGADANGSVYDANRNHILNIDADGNVTDLRGRPVSGINLEDTPGAHVFNSYVDSDGNVIRSSFGGGLQRVETDEEGHTRYQQTDLPEPKGPPQPLSDEARAAWNAVGAGANGEIRAPDGSIIGNIDANGAIRTFDGKNVIGTSFHEAGRLSWFNTADGQHWAWDAESGTFRSMQTPDGTPFRPLSETEWNRIDKQRAPTIAEADHPLPPGEVKPGTEIEGEKGARHISSELGDALRANTRMQPGQTPPGAEGIPGAEGERGSESVRGAEGPAGVEGGEEASGSKTTVGAPKPDSEGGSETDSERIPGTDSEGEKGVEGPTGEEGSKGTEGGEQPSGTKTTTGAGTGATAQQEGARPASTQEGAPAARPSAEPARAEAGDAPRPAAAPEGDARAAADATRTAADQTGGGGIASSAFNRIMDAQNIQQRYEEHIAAGMSPAEAFSLAVAQTGAGNIASDLAPIPGVTNPLSGAALSSLLPGAMSNVMPDQAIQSWVGTGYGALNALGETIGTSAAGGELDASAFDRFAENVANRPGADPFSGWAQVSQLAGEESARTDGGNLLSDLALMRDTGAGVDVANEALSSFQQQVDAGAYKAPLQGINYLTQAAAEVVADPSTTIGQFVDDVKNIYNYGPGDNFWDESLDQTVNVIKNTPIADQVYDGYHQIFTGIAEQGVGDFATEMAEGAYALGGEAIDAGAKAVSNAAGSAYDYVRSWF